MIIVMSEQNPLKEVRPASFEEVRDALKVNGLDHPETKQLLIRWIVQEEAVAEEANGGRANVVVSMEQAFLFSEAGLKDQALQLYHDALYQARQEGEEDLILMMESDIARLEGGLYDEGDLLKEAIKARDERVARASGDEAKNLEKNLNEKELIERFLHNFRGHLPGGYKRIIRTGKLEEDIDAAIKRLDMNREEIVRLQDQGPTSLEEQDQWFNIIKTLYIEMRRVGHQHYPDLTA